MKTTSTLEQILLPAISLYRYEQEIRIIEEETADLAAKKAEPKSGFQKMIDGVQSAFRKDKEDLFQALAKAKKNRDEYRASLPAECDEELSTNESKLRAKIEEYLGHDNGSKRLTLALEIGLREGKKDMPALLRPEKSREAVSLLLFSDEKMIGKILDVYIYSYRRISGEKLLDGPEESMQKGKNLGKIGATVGVVSLLTGLGLGVIAGAALGLSGLALMGKAKYQRDIEYRGGEELLLYSAFIASSDIKKRRFGRRAAKNLRKVGRETPSGEMIHALASGITLYNFRFDDKDSEAAKNALSLYLEMLDNLRSDAEYLAFVERLDMEENYKKTLYAARAVELLHDLLVHDEAKGERDIEIIEVLPKPANA